MFQIYKRHWFRWCLGVKDKKKHDPNHWWPNITGHACVPKCRWQDYVLNIHILIHVGGGSHIYIYIYIYIYTRSITVNSDPINGVLIADKFTALFDCLFMRKHQSRHQCFAILALWEGNHQSSVHSPHREPVRRKCFHVMTSAYHVHRLYRKRHNAPQE